MRLTVLEFAEGYRIKEADASKLLRRAELDGRLEVSYDDSYKATYTGSSERYLELSREYRERMPQRRPSRPRTLRERPQPVARGQARGQDLCLQMDTSQAPVRGFFNGGTE